MINLKNDYCGIAHPKILEKLKENNQQTYIGYGLDDASNRAVAIIKNKFQCDASDIHLLVGGTITNKIVIGHSLKPYEAVICASSGHINVHETGAIEQTGHKVLTIPSYDGKIKGEDVIKIYQEHTDEHMVKPKMVYISNPTEYGTLYTKDELIKLYDICQALHLYLYLDGARLGVALTALTNDIKPCDYTQYTDAFYIGGTKNGLLMGEALVINNSQLKTDLRYAIKHYGGLLAKGFVNGLQFEALFEDDLFFEIGSYVNHLGKLLIDGLNKLGVDYFIKPETNQIFVTFDNQVVEKLSQTLLFEKWIIQDTKTTIRLITHYMLTEDMIQEALLVIKDAIKKE